MEDSDRPGPGGAALTVKALMEARELLMREPEATSCPMCKGNVSNYGRDMLYFSSNGKHLGCYKCIFDTDMRLHFGGSGATDNTD